MGLLKATLLGVTVALLTYYGLLAYVWWGRALPIPVQILALAAGGALSFTFMAGILFSAQTGAPMGRMPILRTYARCFFGLLLMFAITAVINDLL